MPNHFRFISLICWFLTPLLAAGCDAGTSPAGAPADDRPLVAVSLPPLGWLAAEVGGERVRVERVIPPNRDPHAYEPSARELSRIAGAVLFFQVGHPGLPFEDRVARALASGKREPRIVSLAEAAEELPMAAQDPHLWLSPTLLSAGARQLARGLGEVVPEERQQLAARADGLAERMSALDTELRGILERGGCRSFVVDHPAWGAFARHYGLQQLAIESEGKEPGPATLARLLEQARAAGIRRVLVAPGTPLQSSRAVARELGAEIAVLDPLAADVMTTLRRAAELIAGGCHHE